MPRKPKNEMTEKKLEKQIILNLNLFEKCEVAKAGEQSTYNSHYVKNGMSDLIVFIPGCGVLFMEVKSPIYRERKGGGLRKTQEDFRELCLICGVKYAVVYSVKDALNEVRKIKGKLY